jgi:transposase
LYIKRFRQTIAGRTATFIALAHNARETRTDGKSQTRPYLVVSLGDETNADPRYVQDLLVTAQTLYERRISEGMKPVEAIDAVRRILKTMVTGVQHQDDTILETRKLGLRVLLDPIWRELRLDVALREVAKRHRIRSFDFERLVFGLVLNRIVDPKSKLAANEWLKEDAFFPEAEGWDVQHFYRALDLLHEHWGEIEEKVGEALLTVSEEDDRRIFLVDTTSLYFESRENDAQVSELAEAWEEADADPEAATPVRPRPKVVNEPALRMQGHNKDGHPGDPQVVLASACLRNGLVIRHKVYAGNTNDKTIAKDLVETVSDLAHADAKVWVSDGGMTSKTLFETLSEKGWHWLVAESPRKSALAKSKVLPVTGRYSAHPLKKQYAFKAVLLEGEDVPLDRPETMVVVRNKLERERQLQRQAKHLEAAKGALSTRSGKNGGHAKAVCAAATHPSMKRYLKPSEKRAGQYVLDNDAIRLEEQLAGTRMLRTTLTDMEGHELFDGYQLLQEVERNHREYKGPLKLRPCYHRSADRIRAHVMLTVLAGNCVRLMQAQTGENAETLRKIFGRLNAHKVRELGNIKWRLGPVLPEAKRILGRFGVESLPLSWTTWREPYRKPRARMNAVLQLPEPS